MNLYLVQHGKAKSKSEDPNSPLTDVGRGETQLMADMAPRVEFRNSGILCLRRLEGAWQVRWYLTPG